MRSLIGLLALLAVTTSLGGCLFDDDGGDDAASPTEGTEGDGMGNRTADNHTEEPEVPNMPPVLKLTIMDGSGAANVTTNVGGNLTFSIEGSEDADGSLAAAAVVVQDSNGTRFAPLLVDGVIQTATLVFDTAGVVNVTVSILDNDGAIASNQTVIYVNEPQGGNTWEFTLGMSGDAACSGPSGEAILDPAVYLTQPFVVRDNATFVEATLTGGAASIILCDPSGAAISAAGESIVSDVGAALPAGTEYYVGILAQPSAPTNAVSVGVVVHYDPRV